MASTFREAGGTFYATREGEPVCEVVGCEGKAKWDAIPKGAPKFRLCEKHAIELDDHTKKLVTYSLKRDLKRDSKWSAVPSTDDYSCEYQTEPTANACGATATWRYGKGYMSDETENPPHGFMFVCNEHLSVLEGAKPKPAKIAKVTVKHAAAALGYEKDKGGNFCRWQGIEGADERDFWIGKHIGEDEKETETVHHAVWRVKGTDHSTHWNSNVRVCDKHLLMLYAEKFGGGIPVLTPDGKFEQAGVKAKRAVDYEKKIAQLLEKFAGTARARRIEVECEMYGHEETYKRLKRESVA